MDELNNNLNAESRSQLLSGSKGIVIAVIVGIIALLVGISALFGYKSTDQYQGFIKKVENQTESLKENSQGSSQAQPEMPLPVSTQ
jgi:cytoskeletal protein RodZ